MSFKRFLNSHFVFGNKNHISFLQGSSFRFAVITYNKYKDERLAKVIGT